MALPPTTFSRVTLFNRPVTVIRDDLVSFHGLNGNKARKLAHIAMMRPFPKHIACSGGAQSNCMLAVAKLAALHGSTFTYFTSHMPATVHQPLGNLREALRLGMTIKTAQDFKTYQDDIQFRCGWIDEVYWLPMGADGPTAATGMESLASDITEHVRHSQRSARLLVEAGTGATAYYLHNTLQRHKNNVSNIDVIAIACATSPVSLEKRLQHTLEADINGDASLPAVLHTSAMRHRFGALNKTHLRIWRELNQAGICFDLLYAPRAWEQIVLHWQEESSWNSEDVEWMYLHGGGTEGNESMLARYKQSGLV